MKCGRWSTAHGLACTPVLFLLLSACGQSRAVREMPPPTAAKAVAAAPRQPQGVPRPAASAPVRTPLPEGSTHYIVRAGDTVYGIAFRANLNFRDLAAWNGIAEPYVIRIGQRLRLAPPPAAASTGTNAKAPSPVPGLGPDPGSGRAIVADKTPASVPAPLAARPARGGDPGRGPSVQPGPPRPEALGRAEAPATDAKATPAATPSAAMAVEQAEAAPTEPAQGTNPATVAPASAQPAAVQPATTTPPAGSGGPSWRWPASGPLVGRFVAGDQTQQGINIAGSAGQPVAAAADGVVVYSGSGLVGYGELIIVKHSNEWLSAYAHNRRRLVAEGTAVKAGQVIAEMGRTGAARDMLHFEIRRNGKPVDPLQWLPAR